MLWSHCRGTCGAQLQGVVHCARVVVLTVCGCMAQNDAAEVLRAGFEVFYPTVDVRHTLLQGLVQAMCDASCDDLVPRPLAVALFDRLGQVRAVASAISLLVGARTLTHFVCVVTLIIVRCGCHTGWTACHGGSLRVSGPTRRHGRCDSSCITHAARLVACPSTSKGYRGNSEGPRTAGPRLASP